MFVVNMQFVTREMLSVALAEVAAEDFPIRNLLRHHLCELPGVDFHLHCHCPGRDRLSCLSAKKVLQLAAARLSPTLPTHLPWTCCCSRAAFYSVRGFHVVNVWSFDAVAAEGCFEDLNVDRKRTRTGNKVLFRFACEDVYLLKILLGALHRTLNVPHGLGYHLGAYDYPRWKSVENCQLLSGHSCLLRCVVVNKREYQERFVKSRVSLINA